MISYLLIFCLFICLSSQNNEIFGGVDAKKNEFPFVGSLLCGVTIREGNEFKDEPGTYYSYISPATLIDSKHVLTAGHVLNTEFPRGKYRNVSEWKLVVHFGSVELGDWGSGVIMDVLKESIEYRFSETRPYRDDIGILTLKNEVWSESQHMKAIPLAVRDPREGEEVIILGWGFQSNDGKNDFKLKKISLYVASGRECEQRSTSSINLDMSICYFGKGIGEGRFHGVCEGDSGGPNVVKRRGKYYLVGLTARGEGHFPKEKLVNGLGCEYFSVMFSTRVSYYFEWLLERSDPTFETGFQFVVDPYTIFVIVSLILVAVLISIIIVCVVVVYFIMKKRKARKVTVELQNTII